jgi:hypothetical protein
MLGESEEAIPKMADVGCGYFEEPEAEEGREKRPYDPAQGRARKNNDFFFDRWKCSVL